MIPMSLVALLGVVIVVVGIVAVVLLWKGD